MPVHAAEAVGRYTYREMMGQVSPRNQDGIRQLLSALPRELTAVMLPLRIGNETIGAVGASGAPGGDKDEVCVLAGVAKVQDALK